jgi:hypothetical protein
MSVALRHLIRISPNDEESVGIVEKVFQNPNAPSEAMPAMYRYLVRHRPEMIKKRYSKDIRSEFLPLRAIAINSIMELCPPDRWSILKSLMSDTKIEPQLKSLAMRTAIFLGGKSGPNGVVMPPPSGADRCAVTHATPTARMGGVTKMNSVKATPAPEKAPQPAEKKRH